MAHRLYFSEYKQGEVCASIDVHIDYMKEHDLSELTLFEAKRIVGSDMFYCKHYHEVGYKDDTHCGKECGAYSPKNGISGICKYNGFVYEQTENKKTIYGNDTNVATTKNKIG